MLHVVTTGAYYPPVVTTWKILTTGASQLTAGSLCSGSQSISSDYSSLLDQEHDQLYTVCSMRIIVDQWVLKDQNADKNVMSLIVHNHINSLNVIYEKNVRVKENRQLRSHIDVLIPPIKNIRFFNS